jgi:LacI family transcriptional regulator
LAGAADVAMEAGFLLLVVDTRSDASREGEVFEALRARQVDGLMFAAMGLIPFHAPGFMRTSPSILANCFEPDRAVTSVICDEVGGGRSAAQILLDHGHRELVMLAGTADVVATQRRVEGFRSALAAAGVAAREPVPTGWEIDKGFAAGLHVLDRPDRPTGVVCANDRVAIGVALAAGRLGLAIPLEVSIVGYDDDDNVAPCMAPPLTTVALPHDTIGREAMRRLLERIAGKPEVEPEDVVLPCPVIIRESVAAPSR